jgi:uncharacterized metal-binding protein YceD (DUF177 family)
MVPRKPGVEAAEAGEGEGEGKRKKAARKESPFAALASLKQKK